MLLLLLLLLLLLPACLTLMLLPFADESGNRNAKSMNLLNAETCQVALIVAIL